MEIPNGNNGHSGFGCLFDSGCSSMAFRRNTIRAPKNQGIIGEKVMPKQPYLEYLHCLECGYKLGPVVEHRGRTVTKFINMDGINITVFRAEFECPICKVRRMFYSAPLEDE